MSDRDALLAAIRASPDDDLPRLVYADWLDENGASLPPPDGESAADRAAFIRAQIEAARAEPFSPAARAAQARADRLLEAHSLEWTRHVLPWVEGSRFGRGFIEAVEVETRQFPRMAKRVLTVEPVQSVRLFRFTPDFQDPYDYAPYEILPFGPIFASARWRGVSALELATTGSIRPEDYDDLDGARHLGQLRHLSLRLNPVPPWWLTNFLTGDRFPALTGLDLSDVSHVGPAVAAGLARAGHRRFTRLDLSGMTSLQADEVQPVLTSRCLRDVEELRLAWDGPPPGPLTRIDLGWTIPWARLRLLDIAGHGVGPEGAREIARTRDAAGLRWLGLAANGLGPAGAEVLATAPHLNLYHLDVSNNGLRPADVAALRQRFPDAVVVA